jgi:hypothetical protein
VGNALDSLSLTAMLITLASTCVIVIALLITLIFVRR